MTSDNIQREYAFDPEFLIPVHPDSVKVRRKQYDRQKKVDPDSPTLKTSASWSDFLRDPRKRTDTTLDTSTPEDDSRRSFDGEKTTEVENEVEAFYFVSFASG